MTVDGEDGRNGRQRRLSKGYNLATCTGPIADQVQNVLALVFKKNNLYFERWRNVQLSGGSESKLQELDKLISRLEAEIDKARTPREHHFD